MSTCLWMIEYVANSRSTIFPSADYDEELMAVQIHSSLKRSSHLLCLCNVTTPKFALLLRDNSENKKVSILV